MPVILDKKGREIVDPVPSNVSVRRQKMVSLSDQMRTVVQQMRHEALQAEEDSLDDERDFDLPDDEPRSPHELFVETEEYEMLLDDIAAYSRSQKLASAPPPPPSPPAEPKTSPQPAPEPDVAPKPEKGKK
jgi:hypothetical protein